jgi:3-hydroxybutyryl-CoA dehydrogenase
MKIGVVGAGAMGSGIAQVAAQAGDEVFLFDTRSEALHQSEAALSKVMNRLVEKGRLNTDEAESIQARISYVDSLKKLKNCELVIEAIIEDLNAKHSVFQLLETVVSEDCLIASNTSSLSIASLAKGRLKPERIVGIHFFNPAPLMPLVEIIPSLLSDSKAVQRAEEKVKQWGKVSVLAKDTPGFIVNRVARPFYGEAIKMLEEGFASVTEIDAAMRMHGFKMGPFELMDLIGNDINFAVTETVWTQFFYDPRFRPSLTQKRMNEAGLYGRKSGRGYYTYTDNKANERLEDIYETKAERIFDRIFCLLVNEAYDALFMNIASIDDIDIAMTKGVNYPKGLFAWSESYGLQKVLNNLENLFNYFNDDRYRPNPLLRDSVSR